MKTRKMKFNEKDVTYTIEVLPEDLQIEGNASAIDEKTDKEIAEHIYLELERGNIWAWCTVKVTAEWNGLKGTDSLGACSYKDEEDFKQEGGYYQDMKNQALEDLKNTIKGLKSKICNVEVK